MKKPSLLLPGVCARCHHPLHRADSAFCDEHWGLLSSTTRRAFVDARNEARRMGRTTKALLLAVQLGQRELGANDSLAPDLPDLT